MNLLDGLNEKQREAAETTEGPVLILAGAGSGKTRTIIHRIAHIIESGKAWPSQILAITFTNKAAGEMRERIAAMNIKESDRIWMYTFHAMCARIMRIHSKWLGYSDNFIIYDTDDQKRLYKKLIKELDYNDKTFPFQYLMGQISTAKNNFWTPDDYLKNNNDHFRTEKVATYYRRYSEILKKNNAMDFDDLIYNTLVLFKGFPEILEQYQNRFKYILVDEYQDTNHSQYELVNLLAKKHRHLCVCGDDDQSIYMWRGADINNILDFEKDYTDAKVVKLEENYRSTSIILECANKVISNNTGRKEKNLWTRNKGDHKVIVSSFNQGYDEARQIAEDIEILKAEEGYSYSDFAILYRTNAQSRLFEESLMRQGIPFQLIGGTGFYSRIEIKDIISYLHVLINSKDDVGFLRIVNVPKRGIGAATLDKISEFATFKDWSLMETFYRCDEVPELSQSVRNKVHDFATIMMNLKECSEKESISVLIDHVIRDTGYLEMLELGKLDHSENRIENLQELVSSAVEFEKNSDDQSLTAYLETVALTAETDKYDSEDGKLLLMTLHNAKGLEFPVVFLPGVEEGIFPHGRSLDNPEELEEERRICYVGITRAKERLYMSWAAERITYGRRQLQTRSRFLGELPEECIQLNAQKYERNQIVEDAMVEKKTVTFLDRLSYTNETHRPSVAKKKKAASLSEGFNLSDRVKHKKFGIGTIVEVKPNQVSIAFPGVGIKKLDPSFVTKA
ncbi:MAG: 3'-5' exonuclease [Eubacterium sp.]